MVAAGKGEKKNREYSAPAVDRALDILEFMAKHPRPYGTTELARCLKLPVNSVFRILKRLTEREYTVQDPISSGYQLSTRVFSLGMSLYTRFELRQRARPHMEWLCRETEETCQIQIPHGDQMLVIDTVSPEVQFYLRVVPGSLVYYHPNAYGKAVLAFMGEDEVKQVVPSRLVGLTPNTIVLRTELLQQLERTRQTGLAYDNEEYTSGILCIGAPVFDVQGKVVAGLGVTCLLSTIDAANKAAFELLVLECAWRVSKDIGYSGDFFVSKVRAAQPDTAPHASAS
ncbi:MAG TPA: IclR family transcriptional regulator [Spirochaetia bacterium]|nr:IclR family transcriptional regulator [Spirochaetia bacterium]